MSCSMRVILLDHKRYCLINKMVLARAAYNLAEGGLGTTLCLPPPQAHRFFVFRSEASAKRKWLVTKRKGRWEWVPPSSATIFRERETSRNKAEIIRFGNPRWYPLSLLELRKRFRSFFSAFARQTDITHSSTNRIKISRNSGLLFRMYSNLKSSNPI